MQRISYHKIMFLFVIYNLNTELRENNKATVSYWIYTEVQTSKCKLNTHFSFLNIKFNSYVEDSNDIVVEDDIAGVITFAGGVQRTTVQWIDPSIIRSQNF